MIKRLLRRFYSFACGKTSRGHWWVITANYPPFLEKERHDQDGTKKVIGRYSKQGCLCCKAIRLVKRETFYENGQARSECTEVL